jgi:hypothetical protein
MESKSNTEIEDEIEKDPGVKFDSGFVVTKEMLYKPIDMSDLDRKFEQFQNGKNYLILPDSVS